MNQENILVHRKYLRLPAAAVCQVNIFTQRDLTNDKFPSLIAVIAETQKTFKSGGHSGLSNQTKPNPDDKSFL